jgi:hypothetical protein
MDALHRRRLLGSTGDPEIARARHRAAARAPGQSPHVPLSDHGRDRALIFAAFVYHPEWIREWLRFMTHSIEAINFL